MTHLLAICVAVLVGVWTAPAALGAQPLEAYAEDEDGHDYRVVFDRHDRLEFDAGRRFEPRDDGNWSFGATYRLAIAADFPDEEVWWQLRHAFSDVRVLPRADSVGLRLLLFDADYLRHDVSSWILIPGDTNMRIPGPFDIVVRWELGGVTTSFEDPTNVERWEVVEFDVLLDFIRDPNYRHRLAIGATADYELVDSRHELTPLSGATLLWGWENRRGTFAAQAESRFERVAELTTDSGVSWRNRVAASARLEWTPIALNDAPIALFADGHYAMRQGRDADFGVTTGVRFTLPTD